MASNPGGGRGRLLKEMSYDTKYNEAAIRLKDQNLKDKSKVSRYNHSVPEKFKKQSPSLDLSYKNVVREMSHPSKK